MVKKESEKPDSIGYDALATNHRTIKQALPVKKITKKSEPHEHQESPGECDRATRAGGAMDRAGDADGRNGRGSGGDER